MIYDYESHCPTMNHICRKVFYLIILWNQLAAYYSRAIFTSKRHQLKSCSKDSNYFLYKRVQVREFSVVLIARSCQRPSYLHWKSFSSQNQSGAIAAIMSAQILKDLINNSNVVRIKDPIGVRTKIEGIIQAGFKKLLVITDFDYTLSRHSKDGKPCGTTHGIFEMASNGAREDFYAELFKLRTMYLDIEYSPTMSMTEKIPYMEEWWQRSHKLIVENKFHKNTIKEFTKQSNVLLRDNAPEFLRTVDQHNVPLIVFSAGLGNVIEYVLEQQMGTVPKSLHILSNMMQYNEEGICVSFSKPLIHTFNKNSTVVKSEEPFFHKIADRSSVLLLGDSLGDIHMDVGVEKESVVLKIGYLNFNFDTLLDKYMEEYDIVLLNDQTMDVPLEIFNQMHERSSNGKQFEKNENLD